MVSVYSTNPMQMAPLRKLCPYWGPLNCWFFDLASLFWSLALLGNPWETENPPLGPLAMSSIAQHDLAPACLSAMFYPFPLLTLPRQASFPTWHRAFALVVSSAWDIVLPFISQDLLLHSIHILVQMIPAQRGLVSFLRLNEPSVPSSTHCFICFRACTILRNYIVFIHLFVICFPN